MGFPENPGIPGIPGNPRALSGDFREFSGNSPEIPGISPENSEIPHFHPFPLIPIDPLDASAHWKFPN